MIDDLNVVKMTRDGSRTLNRHLRDASLSRLSAILKWVFQKHGKEVLEVKPRILLSDLLQVRKETPPLPLRPRHHLPMWPNPGP
ncbi:hypothetical protein [Metallosphaera javensis (ex Sakai et al. 2022)]|uniref:hypothetical protein n=1 Tax=Metallosphaera javensis (ex Sakai et al. 2022) TaxID=2775498 RepID=UPI003CE54929